jgi:hypothetical protein
VLIVEYIKVVYGCTPERALLPQVLNLDISLISIQSTVPLTTGKYSLILLLHNTDTHGGLESAPSYGADPKA